MTDAPIYTDPKPECTGGIVNASVFFCECDYFDEVLKHWIPLGEKLKRLEVKRLQNVKAPEYYIGNFEEKDGIVTGDKDSEKWLSPTVDICSYWNSYPYNKPDIRLAPGMSVERSALTDMLPIRESPPKRKEADWGDWPYEKVDFKDYKQPVSAGKVSRMMSRYMSSAMEAGISPTNLNTRDGLVLNKGSTYFQGVY